jgi:hypothetical protein
MKIIFDGTPEFLNQLRANTRKILLEQETIALPAPAEESIEGVEKADIIEQEGIKDEENEKNAENGQNKPKTEFNDNIPLEDPETTKNEAQDAANDTPGSLTDVQLLQRDEDKLISSACHPKVIADKIKALLDHTGFLKKVTPKGKNYELALIESIDKKAKKYSDLDRKQLALLYYKLKQEEGDPNGLIETPF